MTNRCFHLNKGELRILVIIRVSPAVENVARTLDAADGVMDGRFFGRQIVAQAGAPSATRWVLFGCSLSKFDCRKCDLGQSSLVLPLNRYILLFTDNAPFFSFFGPQRDLFFPGMESSRFYNSN